MKLQIAGFLDNSLVNGKGFRSVVFLSGCNHKCKGCHNEHMQDFNYGDRAYVEEVFTRIKSNMPIINGVTFSGGEPFEQAKGLEKLAKKIKDANLNLWCYTGYTYEQIIESNDECKIELLKAVDVLVDGKFDENLKEKAPKYAGSSNQRVIDVKATLKTGSIVSVM